MDENDPLSEQNKITLGHNRTNGAVCSKIKFKVESQDGHTEQSKFWMNNVHSDC